MKSFGNLTKLSELFSLLVSLKNYVKGYRFLHFSVGFKYDVHSVTIFEAYLKNSQQISEVIFSHSTPLCLANFL